MICRNMTVSYLLTFKKFYQNKNQHTSFLKKIHKAKKGLKCLLVPSVNRGVHPITPRG